MSFPNLVSATQSYNRASVKRALFGTFAMTAMLALPLAARATELDGNSITHKPGSVCHLSGSTIHYCGECYTLEGAGYMFLGICKPCS